MFDKPTPRTRPWTRALPLVHAYLRCPLLLAPVRAPSPPGARNSALPPAPPSMPSGSALPLGDAYGSARRGSLRYALPSEGVALLWHRKFIARGVRRMGQRKPKCVAGEGRASVNTRILWKTLSGARPLLFERACFVICGERRSHVMACFLVG